MSDRKGKLYVVSTPIGHLGDITFRAVEVLQSVNLILAEDTRHSRRLLSHYNINVPVESYHDHNKEQRTPSILRRLESGQSMALISDAGTPGISDPAFYLVRASLKKELPVIPIPGVSAFLTALVVSGLPTDRFCFEGFLRRKKGRQSQLKKLADEERTIILYESPHRLLKTVQQLLEFLGNREVVIARELTKLHEEFFRGDLKSALDYFQSQQVRGEFVIIVRGKGKGKKNE